MKCWRNILILLFVEVQSLPTSRQMWLCACTCSILWCINKSEVLTYYICDMIWSMEAKVDFFFSKLSYLQCHAVGAYSKKYLGPNPSFIAYSWTQVTNFWPVFVFVFFVFVFVCFLPQFWPVSQLWKCGLWPPWTILCYIFSLIGSLLKFLLIPTLFVSSSYYHI